MDFDDEESQDVSTIYTADEIMKIGLKRVNYKRKRIKRARRKRNVRRFVGHFGVPPTVAAQVWEDLQTTTTPEAFVEAANRNIDHFLMALHHLKKYPTELEREPIFDVDEQLGRDWVWYFVEKIRALKAEKIVWPDFGNLIWVISVDGTDCWFHEPKHQEWSQDRKYFSHKFKKAGLRYELGISLSDGKLVWMNGPFKAGRSDKKIFKKDGLKAKLKAAKQRGIADGGYTGHPELSTPNPDDSKMVRVFKSRALKRHEAFNGMTKRFECLSVRFRHIVARFADCFEAVCVLCQHMVENGEPLFDMLVGNLFNN